MKTFSGLQIIIAVCGLLLVGQLRAQQDTRPADANRAVDAPSPALDSSGDQAMAITWAVETAINRLPEAFRTKPEHRQLMENLERVRGRDFEGKLDDRWAFLLKIAREVAQRIDSNTPDDQLEPLVNLATVLLIDLQIDTGTPNWQAKSLADLEQLESRLAREFPARIELASQVGIERLRCQLYSLPPEQQNEINPDSPQLTSEFIERYPRTAAAAQAAYLAATEYERWALAHLGPNYRPRDDVPEMDEDYFQRAVEQSPNSIWGKAASGALRRIRLVGQTLQVSGRSLDGKFLSLKQFRGNQEVVVFFRPGKSSWGAAETPGDFADAVRRRGFDVLGVLCHLPTAAPDQIAEYVRPTAKDGPHMPLLVDTDDVDTSNSVRYGLTVQRLFVLVDATGKVVRTATDQVKDIDAFLSRPFDTPPADAAAVVSAVQTSPTSETESSPAKFQTPAPTEPETPQVTKIFHLQNGVAADYAKLLQDIFTGTKLTADPRINAILAAGEEQELQKIEALLRALDESKTKPAAPNGSATATEMQKSQRTALAFTATWAGPCQKILPILRSLAEQGAPIRFVDVDREPELAKRHQITSIPAVIIEEDGREVERLVGVASRQKLEKLILGRVVTTPDAPAPARSVAAASFDPFAVSQRSSAPVPSPSRSQPPGLLAIESRAAELAHKVRELTKTHDSPHPELIAARQQLEQTLTEALELKFRSEQRQVASLEQRLTRLKSQLEQRKAAQSQIVERRMRELLENPVTDWDALPDAAGKFPVLLGAEFAPGSRQLASPDEVQVDFYARDQITVDLYATDGIYQNQKLLGAVVTPLNKIPLVVVNVRMVPGDSGKFVFAIVHDPSQRIHREKQQTGKESATRQAISSALKAGGLSDIRWESGSESATPEEVRPAEGSAAATESLVRGRPLEDHDIVVDLYATDGIYQNQTLLGAVVAPLNKIPEVVVNVRMVPGDGGKFVSAIVRNTLRRFLSEEMENGGMSPTRRAIEAALKAGGINDVAWEGVSDESPSGEFLPSKGEAASGAATAPAPITPPTRKPADSLEASARLTLDLAEAEADIRETEARLAIQVKLHAKGVVAIDEVTSAMQRRDRAARKRQILLDEFAATLKDLELQLASAKTEYEGAATMAEQTLALFHLARVSMREVTDANVRRTQADLALQRLQNRFELLKKAGEKLPGAAPGTEQPPADTPAPPAKPSLDPQRVNN